MGAATDHRGMGNTPACFLFCPRPPLHLHVLGDAGDWWILMLGSLDLALSLEPN
jgi:hypothetical protein